ncbi:MAG: helix-turn-helix transcriptional regulator [bacterium]|nr:helix-turn-helix transcriptional regulator [bacterium]MDY4101094.1 helix-turn-helix transcriptional regulator [Lachnospiraceae bacterium]
MKEYIQKNYQKTLDLSAMADTLGFSSAYLTKIFTKHEGMPPV